jgi:hypothetical protein
MVRRLGLVGTVARAGLGLWLVGDVALGHVIGPFRPLPWLLGLVALPGMVLAWHAWWAGRHPDRLDATGPFGHAVHLVLFCGLLALPSLVPALWFAPDAGLLYYGSAMIVAAGFGSSDCEVMALSNRLLRRDDRVGCAVFGPLDLIDRRTGRRGSPASGSGAP